MKVYIITSGWNEDYHIEAVYLDDAKARAAVEKLKKEKGLRRIALRGVEIEEHTVEDS